MKIGILHRTIVAVGISTLALGGLTGMAGASPPPDQQQGQKDKKAQKDKNAQKGHPAQGKSQYPPPGQVKRLGPQEQQVRITQQEQRTAQYRRHLDQQQRKAQQQYAKLQQQQRKAQGTYQQQYMADLRRQQQRVPSNYNYDNDPYFYTPSIYRYSRDGRVYETNQYGADLLQQAVNAGYGQGIRAGQADRQDRWASDYQNSYAYQDANYGYGGFYVEQSDYNAYFREGFRRGYDDGYNSRSAYGQYANGQGSVLATILSAILKFESIR